MPRRQFEDRPEEARAAGSVPAEKRHYESRFQEHLATERAKTSCAAQAQFSDNELQRHWRMPKPTCLAGEI
jgi:hypothetical protein